MRESSRILVILGTQFRAYEQEREELPQDIETNLLSVALVRNINAMSF